MTDLNLLTMETQDSTLELLQQEFRIETQSGTYTATLGEVLNEDGTILADYYITDEFGNSIYTINLEHSESGYSISNSGVFPEVEAGILAFLCEGEDCEPVESQSELIANGRFRVDESMILNFINNHKQLRTLKDRIIKELNKWQNGIEPGKAIGTYPNLNFMVIGSTNISFMRIGEYFVPVDFCKSSEFFIGVERYNDLEQIAYKTLAKSDIEA